VGGASTGGSFLTAACVSLKVTVGGTQAVCVVGQGVGAGLYWGVTVGAKGIASVSRTSGLAQFPATGFAPPLIAHLSRADDDPVASVHTLTTSGGETVVLRGRNLGAEYEALAGTVGVAGLSAPRLVVSYGPAGNVGVNADPSDGGAKKYDAADCVVIVDHFEIACTTVRSCSFVACVSTFCLGALTFSVFQCFTSLSPPPPQPLSSQVPGVGANLTWRVGVASQWGSSQCVGPGCERNATTSYARPNVQPSSEFSSDSGGGGSKENAVAGAGLTGATTTGGQLLIISGVEFGPAAGEETPVVTYGPSPKDVGKYAAQDCEVSVDYSQLRCLTSEGVGKGHWLQVSVGGQSSKPYQANISYSAPNGEN
jgi:hypothetical protein